MLDDKKRQGITTDDEMEDTGMESGVDKGQKGGQTDATELEDLSKEDADAIINDEE